MSGDINTAANTWDIQQNFKVYTDSTYSNEIYNAITSVSLWHSNQLNLDTYNLDNYVGSGSELYVQYDGTNYPNALQDNSGLTVDNLTLTSGMSLLQTHLLGEAVVVAFRPSTSEALTTSLGITSSIST